MKFTKSNWWYKFLKFMNMQDYDNMLPPQPIARDQIDFTEYVAYRDIWNEMGNNLAAMEEDEAACHCFVEGYEEAMEIFEFLVNEELNDRFETDVVKFHEELETFLKKLSE